MKVILDRFTCTVIREAGDMRVEDESHLLHRVKLELIKQGHDVIKKPMWRDGHLTADSQHYVRTRKVNRTDKKPVDGAFCVYDPNYQVRNIADEYKKTGTAVYRREAL